MLALRCCMLTVIAIATGTNTQCIDTTVSLSQSQVDSMVSSLRTAFSLQGQNGLQAGDDVGAVVRLAFHDAAGYDQRANDTFGVDGCVDVTNPDNNGLQTIIATLDNLWGPHCTTISKADFWVLAAKVAIELAAGQGYTLSFRYGRTTNTECMIPGPSRLPAAEGDEAEIRRTFITQMGLTMDDAVALMGAHTLGRAQLGNSGYDGAWTQNTARFDNDFYRRLVDDPWDREVNQINGVTRTTWTDRGEIMLNTDMEIAYFTSQAAQTGMGGMGGGGLVCGPVGSAQNQCGSKALAVTFSNDNAAWLTAFRTSFERMTEVGQTTLSNISTTTNQSTGRTQPVPEPTTAIPQTRPTGTNPTDRTRPTARTTGDRDGNDRDDDRNGTRDDGGRDGSGEDEPSMGRSRPTRSGTQSTQSSIVSTSSIIRESSTTDNSDSPTTEGSAPTNNADTTRNSDNIDTGATIFNGPVEAESESSTHIIVPVVVVGIVLIAGVIAAVFFVRQRRTGEAGEAAAGSTKGRTDAGIENPVYSDMVYAKALDDAPKGTRPLSMC